MGRELPTETLNGPLNVVVQVHFIKPAGKEDGSDQGRENGEGAQEEVGLFERGQVGVDGEGGQLELEAAKMGRRKNGGLR